MPIEIKCSSDISTSLPLSALTPFQGELKKLSDANYKKLRKQIETHGFIVPFFVWKSKSTQGEEKNYILDGHQREEVLSRMATEGVKIPDAFPVVYVEAQDAKDAKSKLLAINSQYGTMTEAGLFDFIDGDFDFGDLSEFTLPVDMKELKKFFDESAGSGGGAGEDSIPEMRETDIIAGDMFQLGRHRILCGDSTSADDVAKLMGELKVDCVVTDPPYGVDYTGGGIGKDKTIRNAIKSDIAEDYRQWFSSFLSLIPFADYNTFYIFMSCQELHNLRLAIEDCGFKWGDYLVWIKNSLVLGRKDYNARYEFIVYGWKNHHKFYGPTNSTTTLEFDRPTVSKEHPTMKPIELLKRLITDGTLPDAIVMDCFLGSGSTLIACEETGRSCYGMEIEPGYCQVIIDRWEKLTGQKAEKINGELTSDASE